MLKTSRRRLAGFFVIEDIDFTGIRIVSNLVINFEQRHAWSHSLLQAILVCFNAFEIMLPSYF